MTIKSKDSVVWRDENGNDHIGMVMLVSETQQLAQVEFYDGDGIDITSPGYPCYTKVLPIANLREIEKPRKRGYRWHVNQ